MIPIDFRRLRELVGMAQVLDVIGWRPRRKLGAQLYGPCPLRPSRRGRDRVFTVNGDRWFCFGCSRGGNHLDLWAAVRGLPLLPAAYELCERLHVAPPLLPLRPRPPRQRPDRPVNP